MKSGHLVTFSGTWIGFGILALIVIQILKNLMESKNFEVDEDLPDFFDAITLEQADQIV